MSRLFWSLGALTLLFLAEHAAAVELCSDCLGRDLRCTRCAAVPCCCPDDYCRKPMPCIPCLALPASCDCYCRKPMPCIPCVCIPSCVDDYCRKPCPTFCWPVDRQLYRCPPGNDTAARACRK